MAAFPSRDVASIWRPGDLPDLTVLHARYRAQRFPRHIHEEYVVGVNEGGAHSFYCRGARHPVPDGTIALINPGDVHTGEPLGDGEWNYRGFYPTEQFLRELWEESTQREAGPSLVFNSPVVRDPELARRLIAASQASESGAETLHASSELVEALTLLLIRYCDSVTDREIDGVSGSRTAIRARAYIDAHALKAITLRDLAEAAETGRFGVLRAFRREYGMAPYQYVIAIRIGHAKRLLQAGVPVATTAFTCGFSDQSHLHRHFRRLVGVTPGAYAQAASSPRRSGDAVTTSSRDR